ncbi:MAG: TlpA family protein disulfide reductase [Clostridia bacterium]|nr:TlpA family protein disulfide reductase [Clostridia bacterium]
MTRTLWIALRAAAVLLLAGALVFFNLPAAPGTAGQTDIPAGKADPVTAEADPADAKAGGTEEAPSAPAPPDPARFLSDAPYGCREGEQLPNFSITLTDGTVFTLSACRGRAVFLNLWATWCTPCVAELPYFDRLRQDHPNDVFVLAVHSGIVNDDDLQAFLAENPYGIAFAVDTDDSVTESVGGSLMLPQTVVLNRRGEVVFNRTGSVTPGMLEELTALALADEKEGAPVPGPVLCEYAVFGGMIDEHSERILAKDPDTGAVTLTVAEGGARRTVPAPDSALDDLLALLGEHPPETWAGFPESEYFALDAPTRYLRMVFPDGTEYSLSSTAERAWEVQNIVVSYFSGLEGGGN